MDIKITLKGLTGGRTSELKLCPLFTSTHCSYLIKPKTQLATSAIKFVGQG